MSTSQLLEFATVYMLAAAMPGPSIILIIRNGILISRWASIQAAFGTIIGTMVQSGMVMIGLIFIDNNSYLFKFMQLLSSSFLVYLGTKLLLNNHNIKEDDNFLNKTSPNKNTQHFIEAFLVEFLNPLAFTFFISVMTVFIKSGDSQYIKIIYWLEILFLSSIWFSTVAIMSSSKKITFHNKKFNQVLQIISGLAFVFFGSRVFF